jgi:uroporphyrinogen-III synthase
MSLIPYVMPPLRGLRVLVTRPAEQAARLGALIAAQGGEARVFSSIAIEPIAPTQDLVHTAYEWLVFLSAHAVQHGVPRLPPELTCKTVAIGRATARALQDAERTIDLVPPPPHTSETLLAMPEFAIAAGDRVLVVRGEGGREALDQALMERGASVDSLVVYRRVPATYTANERAALEGEWLESGIDIVTATSLETLQQLHAQLGPAGQTLLQQTPLLVVSARVAAGARALGLRGECVPARAADDASLLGALAHWHSRAR